jgi:tetratricopeptide (TPR) repeat protein
MLINRMFSLLAGHRRFALTAAAFFGVLVLSPVHAQEAEQEQERGEEVQSLDPRVAKQLLGAYEKLESDNFQGALADLNQLLQKAGDMKPFDRASVYQIRGQAHVNLDRVDLALKDFQSALNENALPEEASLQLRYNVAQLHFQQENYKEAIRGLVEWMRATENPGANAWFLLAAALYYENDYEKARVPAERALQLAETRERRQFDLTNMIYSELGLTEKRTRLLSIMVSLWADEVSYWKQLAAIYMQEDRSKDALSTMELAYNSGLIDEQSDILSLAQLYSVHNNPHRGAKVLAKGLKDEKVERTVTNLELLSQLLSQAREHRAAIPVLQEAAGMSDKGVLSYRLGQVLLADEQNEEAEKALAAALDKGGLDENQRANAWMLLGTSRFNEAGPGDRDQRASADKAFASAAEFAMTRNQANGWREYIKAINDTEDRQARLEREQAEMLAEAARERELSACRSLQIAGRTLTDECVEVLESES